jgi:hypothetical protein
MKSIKLVATSDKAGHLKIDIPTSFSNKTIEVRIGMTLLSPKKKKPLDFSDLAGKLKWTGDALDTQRSLRDEW